jgi:hypothetical protein
MNNKNSQQKFVLVFQEQIVQLMDQFFITSFKKDIDELMQGVKHPAHPLNSRMKQLINANEQCSPIGIDIPVLIPSETEPNATVILLGQDPLRRCKDIDKAKVFNHAFIGTPYSVHHTNGLPTATRVYLKLIERLLAGGCNVYLTDVRKYYPASKIITQADMDLLIKELNCFGGKRILILSGRQAQEFYENNKNRLNGVHHGIPLPHLSGFGPSGEWKELAGAATHEAKIEYVMKKINEMRNENE